jgi:methionyl-tRNA formyltransferase
MVNDKNKNCFFRQFRFFPSNFRRFEKAGILPEIVVTTPDKPQGRKMIITPTQTKVWAEEHSIEYIEQNKLKDEKFLEKMKNYNLYLVASYGKIIPKELIDIPKFKVLNIHPSLLPKYRGPSPLQEQIINNEQNIGVSVMLIDEYVDHGPVLVQEKVPIFNWPISFNELSKTLSEVGTRILAENLTNYVRGKLAPKEQKDEDATFTKKIEKIDGLIDLNSDSYKNYLKYLAYENWPGVFFEVEKDGIKKKIIIKKAEFKEGQMKILKVVPEGKKEMSYEDFLRGQR